MKTTKKQREDALSQIKAVVDDGFAEINGRKYTLTKLTHNQRLSVFSYTTSVKEQLQAGNFLFMSTPEFKRVMSIMEKVVLFEDSGIDTLKDHWEKYPEDFVIFVSTFMSVISYPFMIGSHTA